MATDTTILMMIKAWETGTKRLRGLVLITVAFFVATIGAVALTYASAGPHGEPLFEILTKPLVTVLGSTAAALSFVVSAYQRFLEQRTVEVKIQAAEDEVRKNPERPQLAWELAQTKLESYLNRNLAQVRSIFWLTAFVMLVGFAFVLYGVVRAFEAPQTLPVAVVSSVSGVLISFIGGSFLIVYRSTLAQSKDYVAVLERINAVGMCVQVLETIPAENATLKQQTTADIAKGLLRLYTVNNPTPQTRGVRR